MMVLLILSVPLNLFFLGQKLVLFGNEEYKQKKPLTIGSLFVIHFVIFFLE